MDKVNRLQELGELLKSNTITKKEFEKLKSEILFPKKDIPKNPKLIELEELLDSGAITKDEFGSLKNVDSIISLTPSMVVWDPSLYTLSDIKNSGKLSRLSNEDLKMLLIEWDSFYTNLLDWGDFYVSRGDKYFDYLINLKYKFINTHIAISRKTTLN